MAWSPIGSDFIGAKWIASRGYEPQRTHNFEMLFQSPAGGDQIILKSVETGFAPAHNSEPLMMSYMNETIYLAGRPMYDAGTVQFRDWVDMPTWGLLEDWYNLVYNPYSSEIGYATEYKTNSLLTFYDVKGGSPRSWQLVGLWPQMLAPDAPTHTGSDYFRISVTFYYDKAVFQG